MNRLTQKLMDMSAPEEEAEAEPSTPDPAASLPVHAEPKPAMRRVPKWVQKRQREAADGRRVLAQLAGEPEPPEREPRPYASEGSSDLRGAQTRAAALRRRAHPPIMPAPMVGPGTPGMPPPTPIMPGLVSPSGARAVGQQQSLMDVLMRKLQGGR